MHTPSPGRAGNAKRLVNAITVVADGAATVCPDQRVHVKDGDELPRADAVAEESHCEGEVIWRCAAVYFVPVEADQARASCWGARSRSWLVDDISISVSGCNPRVPALT